MTFSPPAGSPGVEWVVFKSFPVRDEHGRWKPLGADPPESQTRRIGTVTAPDRDAAVKAARRLWKGRLTVRSKASVALDAGYRSALERNLRPVPLERLMRKRQLKPPAVRRAS